MPYLVICQKPDGSIEVAAHPGEATPEMLADAQPAASVDEAAQMVRDTLGGQEGATGEQPPAPGAESSGEDSGEMPGAEGMPMDTRDDQMAAGFQRARKGY